MLFYRWAVQVFWTSFGRKSLTYKNGLEARKKRQLVDRSFSHDAVMNYYEHFTQVLFCFFSLVIFTRNFD